jgi:hypothetical protein
MILSQPEIRAEVEKGQIRFDPPLEERQWHEASVDLRLGFTFAKLTAKRGLKISLAHGMPAIVGTGLWKEKVLKAEDELGKKETYTLDPELATGGADRVSKRLENFKNRIEACVVLSSIENLSPSHHSSWNGFRPAGDQVAGATGTCHFNPGNRAKSRSNVTHSQPHSMASAAYHVSVTRDPRVSVSMQSRLKISQCRSPGSTIWQWG